MAEFLSIWIALVAAHTVADFAIDIRRRRPQWPSFVHALVHAGLGFLSLGLVTAWQVPLTLVLAHLVLDRGSLRSPRSELATLLLRQLGHLLVLAALTSGLLHWFPPEHFFWRSGLDFAAYPRYLCVLTGFLATVQAGSVLIAHAVAPYLVELERAIRDSLETITRPPRGLTNAGNTIGRLERTLIFLFVLSGNLTAIGFLVAAKSIFRFGELSNPANRMESEYIIIGTLMSFVYAIVVSHATLFLFRALAS